MRRYATPLLVILGLSLAACKTVSVPAKTGSYQLKQQLSCYRVEVSGTVEDAFAATLKGLEDLEITPVEKKNDQLSGLATAKFADGTALKITLLQSQDNLVRMEIGAGDFADEARCTAVFRAIAKHLKK